MVREALSGELDLAGWFQISGAAKQAQVSRSKNTNRFSRFIFAEYGQNPDNKRHETQEANNMTQGRRDRRLNIKGETSGATNQSNQERDRCRE